MKLSSLVPYVFGSVALTYWLIQPAVSAEIPQPEAVPMPPPIAAPVDQPYPGTIDLNVDATDVRRRIVSVHETVPVTSAELTLLYPKWIPGTHAPVGPISKLAGLVVTAEGQNILWTRDRVDMYAFHINVPPRYKAINVDFQYLSPLRDESWPSFSSKTIDVAWNTVLLYPAGYYSRSINFLPSLKLAPEWQFASALDVASQTANIIHFKPAPLNTLIDSPVYAGVNYKRIDLSSGPDNPVFLDVFSDLPANLAATPEQIQLHRNLVKEARKLFASRHYTHYDFLFLLSDTVGGFGLEHHQSSEDSLHSNYFTDWGAEVGNRDLLAHEYAHSWNGKFRRPADLWTPNFNVPMQDDLLWVYEGLTQYLGYVLTARAGLRTPAESRDMLALAAAYLDASPGRTWRSLVDTTNQPIISQGTPATWFSWQRLEDYYVEGMLIWLDVDTKIRELSSERKSLDDFAKLFFGNDNGSYITQTYTFSDLLAALNKVQPYDWQKFLQTRVYELAPQTPQQGIVRGGYRLAYTDTIPDWVKHGERPDTSVFFMIGISIKADGTLDQVLWNSPAFNGGVTPDMKLTAVNGVAFTPDVLRNALIAAEKIQTPIKFLFKRGNEFETIDIDYHGGLRFPKLERLDAAPNRLDAILSPAK
jgi:predicted metalloprotease with PDZ domain